MSSLEDDEAPVRKRPGRPPRVAFKEDQDPGPTLQIEADLKQDAIALSNVHNETLQQAKTKEPYLYNLFVEKSQLKFKSQLYLKNKVKVHTYKNLKNILANFDGEPQPIPPQGSYGSVESGYLVQAKKKYCDFTGYESKYTHKDTRLRYY